MTLTSCNSAEVPAPTASIPAQKSAALAPEVPACNDCIPVTADNFNRAESDMYFAQTIKLAGGIGKLFHCPELEPIDKQLVIRANRDTLYSAGVFDLDAGTVTVTMPDPSKRFMSMIAIDEDEYAHATYFGAATHSLTKQQIGTRYVLVGIRTFVDPASSKDVDEAHALQAAIKVSQKSAGSWEAPNWDPVSQKKVRDALIVLAGTLPDTRRMFGPQNQVDPVRHLIGSATGWGGNAEKDALYLTVVPSRNDGKTSYRMNVKDVPVDAFWSISAYNAKGYFEENQYGAYTLNNITAKKDADGSVTIQFGDCDGNIPNCLLINPGWNYWVRLYRPRGEILNGQWKFPDPQPAR
jgi:hypothetical protein